MRQALVFAALLLLAPAAATAQPLPASLLADPPPDAAHPAGMIAFGLPTHGVKINAVLYTAAGAGPHPTVLLLHGLPGNEQNLDLARAMQREGWNVLTMHYRGSWGSRGDYTFAHCIEDAQAAVAWLRAPDGAAAAHIDPGRIVVVGHSLGGFVTAYVAGHDPNLLGAALISAADVSRVFGPLKREQIVKGIEDNIENDAGMHTLGDATAGGLADEVLAHAKAWDLAQFAPTLASHPLLVVTSDDGLGPTDDALSAAVGAEPGAMVTHVHFATDHGYDDRRIGLAATLIRWLETLPGAPGNP
jgi:pimeloyl-ACP methyl ester carboxylesterase